MIVDIEATCEKGGLPLAEMEIIEIGAVVLKTGRVTDEFQSFIRPQRRPQLTPFCIELTGIAQAQVDGAPLFPESMARFGSWLATHGCAGWGSWGDYDRRHIAQECATHSIANPLAALPHRNLKEEFATAMQLDKAVGMAKALEIAGLELAGSHHRALDDARNISRLTVFIGVQGNKSLS